MVNWVSVRAMLTLSTFRELHTRPVDFVLAYTQADAETEIFMKLPIGFGVEGTHHREWVIRLDKNFYGLKYAVLACFEKVK